jgi:hypothetical protein
MIAAEGDSELFQAPTMPQRTLENEANFLDSEKNCP